MMDVSKFSRALVSLGAVLLVGSFIWWFSFWGDVARQLNRNVFEALDCLFLTSGKCGEIAGFASLAGKTAYTPIFFWIGAVLAAIGALMRRSVGATNGGKTAGGDSTTPLAGTTNLASSFVGRLSIKRGAVLSALWAVVWVFGWGISLNRDLPRLNQAVAVIRQVPQQGTPNVFNPISNNHPALVARRERLTEDLAILLIPVILLMGTGLFAETNRKPPATKGG